MVKSKARFRDVIARVRPTVGRWRFPGSNWIEQGVGSKIVGEPLV